MSEFGRTLLAGILAAAFVLPHQPAMAEERDLSVEVHGQYRPRYYFNQGHDFLSGGGYSIAKHRARLGAAFLYRKLVGAYVEIQDVRTFGDELNTLSDFSAGGLDMHQAYARILPVSGLELKVGRQEIALENHRLIGTVGWTEQARSFDGARATFKRDALTVDGFYARVADDFSYKNAADEEPKNGTDIDLGAVNVHYTLASWLSLGAIAVVDAKDDPGLLRTTAGLLATGTAAGVRYAVEGYYQMGSDDAVDYGGYLAAVHVAYDIPVAWSPYVELFGELVSGDDDPTDDQVGTFDTLYATNHKFYGEMDFFLNLPVHTGGRGLMDLGAAVGATPLKNVGARITVHHFRAAADLGDDLSTFGTEIDARLDWSPIPHLKLDAVYGVFLPGDILEPDDGQPEHMVYATMDVTF